MKRNIISISLVFTFLFTMFSLGQLPAAQAVETNNATLIRYAGANRESVAVNVARAHFIKSNKVIIVNRDKFPDAISATNISQGVYPVLYTREGRLDQQTIDLLNEMPLNEIYLIGGTSSIGETVAEELRDSIGVKVTRIDGKDRFIVNMKAVQMNFNSSEHVVIASGDIYTDALYGVSYANTIDAPVILAKRNQITQETLALLKKLGVKRVTLIGGQNTLTSAVENQLKEMAIKTVRIAGANRYSGSTEVAIASYNKPQSVVIASGEVFSDALVSAPLAQKLNAPILLVRKDRLDNEISAYLNANKVSLSNIYIQGGPGTVSLSNEGNILTAVAADPPVIKEELVSEVIPFYKEPIIQYSDQIYVGEENITRKAQVGKREITTRITYVNGKEISHEIIKEEVIEEAVAQIIVRGTKDRVETIDKVTTEIIPAPTEPIIQYSADLFVGEESVTREYHDGLKKITTQITYINEKEVSRKVIKEEIIREPLAKIIIYGTKEKPKTVSEISQEGLTEEEKYSRSQNKNYEEYELINNYYLYPKKLPDLDIKAVNEGYVIDELLLNKHFLELVNALRKEVGVPILISDSTLSQGTKIRSVELAGEGTIRPYYIDENGKKLTGSHIRPYNKETGSFERFHTAFYYRDAHPSSYLGENVAQYSYHGNPYTIVSEKYIAEKFYTAWFNSPGHYNNMIRSEYDGTWLSIAVGDFDDYPNFNSVFGTQILTTNAKAHNK